MSRRLLQIVRMKKLIFVFISFVVVSNSLNASVVCYPNMGGGGQWDCFWSNGSCGVTWDVCNCPWSGSSSGCSTCYCGQVVLPADNNTAWVTSIDLENQIKLAYMNNTPINLGSANQLDLKSNEGYEFLIYPADNKVIFYVYDLAMLLGQVENEGYIYNKEATYKRSVTINY